MRTRRTRGVALATALVSVACSTSGRPRPPLADGPLGCPSRPNCVSSEATDPTHAVPPFALRRPPAAALDCLATLLADTPGVRVTDRTPTSVRAEATSRVFRFVDDVDVVVRPAANHLAVRSASRVGYADLGVNRRRVDTLRRRYDAACGADPRPDSAERDGASPGVTPSAR